MANYQREPTTAIYADVLEWLEVEDARKKCANSLQGKVCSVLRDRGVRTKETIISILASRDNIAYSRVNEQQFQVRIDSLEQEVQRLHKMEAEYHRLKGLEKEVARFRLQVQGYRFFTPPQVGVHRPSPQSRTPQ